MPATETLARLGALISASILGACAASPAPEAPHRVPGTPIVSYEAVTVDGGRHDVTSSGTLPCGTTKLEAVVHVESSAGADLFRRTRAAAADLDLRASGGLRRQPRTADGRLLLDVDPLLGAFMGHELEIVHDGAPAKLAASWKQDISCHREVGVTGKDGHGAQAAGDEGPRLTAYVTKARSSSLGPVTFVIVEGTGKPLYWVAPLGADVTIHASGGAGGPGGRGGHGGTVEIELDERFPELEKHVSWQARGGKGNGGGDGLDGEGSVRSGDVLLTLIARSDLPAGFSILDAPIAAKHARLRPLPRARPQRPPPFRDPSKVHRPIVSKPRKPPERSLILDPLDGRR
jgi:hypothetical protein